MPSLSVKVTLKKEYQNHRRQKNPLLVGGGAWYNLQAFRAVNQAIGRQEEDAPQLAFFRSQFVLLS